MNAEPMSIAELIDRRNDVWKEYMTCVHVKDVASMLKHAKILDVLDELLLKRIQE